MPVLQTPNSTVSSDMFLRKRPSEAPPLEVRAGVCPVCWVMACLRAVMRWPFSLIR